MELHSLLRRQLRRLGLPEDAPPADPAAWAALLERVSRAYDENDQERYVLERSQELASKEMAELNAALREERDGLDARVRERTAALQLSQGRLSSLLTLSADWVWEQDERLRFTYVSEGMANTCGIDPAALLQGGHFAQPPFACAPEAGARWEAAVAARCAFRDHACTLTGPDGRVRHLRVSGEPVADAAGRFTGWRGVARDVTQATLAEQQVAQLAHYDSVTGLPNRHLFAIELDRALARAQRYGTGFAVCFIDLDHFKGINDTLGHDAGDELLRVMARRLRGSVRNTDLVARLGGDEFVTLLDGEASATDRAAVAAKLLAALGQPLLLAGRAVNCTGSLGIALWPEHGATAAELLKHADAAMYQAKAQGKNQWHFYSAELDERVAREFETENALRRALERDELLLHYQPKYEVEGGALVGMEALVRWQHPERGMVPPGDFIPLAEQRGLIVPLGRWVLREACRQIARWRAAGLAPPPVAINLSARQFTDDGLLPDLLHALAESGVQPGDIELELTESALMADPERANALLHRLHGLGVRIAIDDFGTGYSSLSYLKRFPAQVLKIDRSFVSGLPADTDDTAITHAVVALAHTLGLKVVAEGVETVDQLKALQRLGCDEAQGYLLGRPMPPGQLAACLPEVPASAAQPPEPAAVR